MGRPLARQAFLPSPEISRWRSRFPSSSGARPFSARPGRSAGTPENSALTKALAAPVRIRSREVRPPSTAPMASMTMDLPAPVSPVRALKPGRNRMSASSMTAIFSMCRSSSMAAVSSILKSFLARHPPEGLLLPLWGNSPPARAKNSTTCAPLGRAHQCPMSLVVGDSQGEDRSPLTFHSISLISWQRSSAASVFRITSKAVSSPAREPTISFISILSRAEQAPLARPGMVFTTTMFWA